MDNPIEAASLRRLSVIPTIPLNLNGHEKPLRLPHESRLRRAAGDSQRPSSSDLQAMGRAQQHQRAHRSTHSRGARRAGHNAPIGAALRNHRREQSTMAGITRARRRRPMNTADLKVHPLVADLFPAMADAAFEELVVDIEANGQNEPVMLYEGHILDGFHRYKIGRA